MPATTFIINISQMIINDFEKMSFDVEGLAKTLVCLAWDCNSLSSFGGNCINDALMGKTISNVRPI